MQQRRVYYCCDCGYRLSEVAGYTCPECGRSFSPSNSESVRYTPFSSIQPYPFVAIYAIAVALVFLLWMCRSPDVVAKAGFGGDSINVRVSLALYHISGLWGLTTTPIDEGPPSLLSLTAVSCISYAAWFITIFGTRLKQIPLIIHAILLGAWLLLGFFLTELIIS